MRNNFDRRGNQRCDGYRKEDFVECGNCRGKDADPLCEKCGGDGEYPKIKRVFKNNRSIIKNMNKLLSSISSSLLLGSPERMNRSI